MRRGRAEATTLRQQQGHARAATGGTPIRNRLRLRQRRPSPRTPEHESLEEYGDYCTSSTIRRDPSEPVPLYLISSTLAFACALSSLRAV